MAYVRPRRRKDGFFNLTSPLLPTLSEGQVLDGPDGNQTPPIYVPPLPYNFGTEFEVDFYSLNCDQIQKKMDSLASILATGKWADPAIRAYYQDKLSQAQSAWQLRCGASTDPIKPIITPEPTTGTSTGEPTTGGSATPTPINPTVNLPTGSSITIGPGVSPKGTGGGSSSKSDNKKKNNWWIWAAAAAALGVILHQTSKN